MFKTQNFCHIASNNRNNVKAGVFIYKTNDNLQTVSASGYFNPRIIDINLHDLIIHEYIDPTDNTKVLRNVLCVTVKTLDNIETVVIKSNWQGDIEQEIADLRTYVDNNFVKTDGTSVMTGPLLMRATDDFKCAIAPYWDGVGFFKLNDNNSVTLMASLEYQDSFAPAENNVYNIGSTSKKWKNLYLAGKAYMSVINNGFDIAVPVTNSADTLALLSDIAFKSTDVELTTLASGQFLMYDGSKWINSTQGYANTDLSNLTPTGEAKFTAKANTGLDNLTDAGKNIGNWSSNITNCITEIPQDIKLELSSGTLTLKAGSKVYVPNGTGVFDTFIVETDLSCSTWGSGSTDLMVAFDTVNSTWGGFDILTCGSGPIAPVGATNMLWYDTTNNKVKQTSNGGSTWNDGWTLPIFIVSRSSGAITSIQQVFNGFGYIGSIVFALPGIKGLIPNGRNTDGTLNNTVTNDYNTVKTVQVNTTTAKIGMYVSGGLGSQTKNFDLNEPENYNYDNGVLTEALQVARVIVDSNSQITAFSSKTVFHAVDYNDSEYIAHCAMPSSTTIPFTLPASGSYIIAPADGYLKVIINCTAGGYLNLDSNYWHVGSNGGYIGGAIPSRKGKSLLIQYSNYVETIQCVFIPSIGAV